MVQSRPSKLPQVVRWTQEQAAAAAAAAQPGVSAVHAMGAGLQETRQSSKLDNIDSNAQANERTKGSECPPQAMPDMPDI
jgi:hypothetical protein